MFRRLKLLQSLHEINLSPEEALALMRRLETATCRPEDSEALIRIERAHTPLSAEGWEAPPAWNGLPPRAGRPASVRAPRGLVAVRTARGAWVWTRRAACVTLLGPTDRARVNRIWVGRGGSADEPPRNDHVERRSR